MRRFIATLIYYCLTYSSLDSFLGWEIILINEFAFMNYAGNYFIQEIKAALLKKDCFGTLSHSG